MYSSCSHGNVIVHTDQGQRIAVHKWTSKDCVVHFLHRLGYASILHKEQGDTLEYITLWSDEYNPVFPILTF